MPHAATSIKTSSGSGDGLGEIGDFQVIVFREEKSFHFVWAAALRARSLKPGSPTVTQIRGFLELGGSLI